MGGAHQDARPELAAPVPPSAWSLWASAVMLDGDQLQRRRAVGVLCSSQHYGLGTADLLKWFPCSGCHTLFPKGQVMRHSLSDSVKREFLHLVQTL